MSCTSGCPTPGLHSSWGECLRSKRVQIDNIAGHMQTKKFEKDQQAYYDARKSGIQPASPLRPDVDRAVRISEKDGEAWRA